MRIFKKGSKRQIYTWYKPPKCPFFVTQLCGTRHQKNLINPQKSKPNKNVFKNKNITMGEMWRYLDKALDPYVKNNPETRKIKNRNVLFCILCSQFFSMAIHQVTGILKLSFSISWMQVQMYHHRFNIYPQILNGDPAKKWARTPFLWLLG